MTVESQHSGGKGQVASTPPSDHRILPETSAEEGATCDQLLDSQLSLFIPRSSLCWAPPFYRGLHVKENVGHFIAPIGMVYSLASKSCKSHGFVNLVFSCSPPQSKAQP